MAGAVWCDICGRVEVRYRGLWCWLCSPPSPAETLRRRGEEATRERAERLRREADGIG